jgi:drug/metabolite transporter (DMT)-like permease
VLWSLGSLYSRRAHHVSHPLLATAMQMLCGGLLLGVVAVALGEPFRFSLDALTPRALVAFVYLIAIGSLVGYTAYAWLLRVAPISLVSTYAYVNPVVAVFLGWLIEGERIEPRTVVAGAVIVVAVAIIVWARGREEAEHPEEVAETA